MIESSHIEEDIIFIEHRKICLLKTLTTVQQSSFIKIEDN